MIEIAPINYDKMLPIGYERYWLKEEKNLICGEAEFIIWSGATINPCVLEYKIQTYKPLKAGFDQALGKLVFDFLNEQK